MNEESDRVCDFCLRSQNETLVIFSSRNNKFHICDFCIQNMFNKMMSVFRGEQS